MPSSKIGKASITVRCTSDEKKRITQKWKALNFTSESEYIRFVALNAEITVKVEGEK